MIIYRFRLTSEDHEDFLREIEIQPTQTFLDFHEIVVNCANLEKCTNAFFYTTDNKFKKKKEFSLKDQRKEVRKYDDDTDQVVTATYVPHLMKKSILKDYIDDPHQRLIYEFIGKDSYALFIELYKIIKTDECFPMPRCVNKKGELPKKPDKPLVAEPEEEGNVPPVPIIAPPTFVAGEKSMFTEMVEDDAELAEIEKELDGMLEDETVETEVTEKESTPAFKEDNLFLDSDDEEAEEDKMESLDEYEDIEDFEIRQGNYDNDSDDY